MQALIVVSLEDDKFDNVVQHCEKVEENLKKIFETVDPDLTVRKWFSRDDGQGVKELAIALVTMANAAVVYFCKGWEKHKELDALHYICELYGIQRMEE